MNNEKFERGVKLTFRCKDDHHSCKYDRTQTYESGCPDEDIYEIIHGFYTCMVGAGWQSNTILENMKNYVEENLGGEFIRTDESNED